MFCPNCRAEYREGITQCADCKIPLVDFLPQDLGDPDVEMVEIFDSSNPLEISLAKSLLEEAEIEYAITGDDLRYLLGAGGGGLAANPTTGPARLFVRTEDQRRAEEALEGMPEEIAEPAESEIE